MFDRAIIESALPPLPTAEIAHYTRIGTLCNFIQRPAADGLTGWTSAWATPVQFLNDRRELSHGLKILQDAAASRSDSRVLAHLETLNEAYGTPSTDAFQMSFSANADDLGQWRGYAENGMGCSVVTDVVSAHAVADVAGWVIYEAQAQRVFAEAIIGRLPKAAGEVEQQQILVAAACFMKHDGFRAEQEYRLLKFPDSSSIKFRATGDRLVPFVDYLASTGGLPIRRIIVGPSWQIGMMDPETWPRNHVIMGIQRLLSATKLHQVRIVPSTIPYDPR